MKTVNGEETVYTYNALNQLVSDSETTYEYDLNGNLVRVIGSAQSALYEYNSENKLVKATVQNGSLVIEESYTYDYQGNRTSKTTHRSDGVTEYVKYLNDNSSLTNVLAEMGSEGSVQAYYTIGADLISQERDGKVSVYLYDGHGSVVGLANESGKVTDTYVYDAFGNLISSTGSTENYYRYCGEQFDETTGLYYLRARYMDTSTGRFISQDSYAGSISDPISLHKYLYANANPVTYTDPSGYISAAELTLGQACLLMIGSGVVSGLINMGLSILHDLTYEKELNNIGVYICDFLIGFCSGAALAGIGILAASFMATWVFMVFAAGGIYGAYTSFVACEFESNQGKGHEDLARAYWWLGVLNLASAGASFKQAVEISNLKAATDLSVENSDADLFDDGWGNWNDYEHVIENGREYARINGRNYSHHAVDRMQPSGFRYIDGQAIVQSGGVYGRSVSPHIVEYSIGTSVPLPSKGNFAYTNGSVTVITNENGDVVSILIK